MKNINFSIGLSETCTVKLNENDLKIITRDYNGDYKRYIAEYIIIDKIKTTCFKYTNIEQRDKDIAKCEVFNVSRDLIKKTIRYISNSYTKKELETLYFNNKDIVATNTRAMIVINNNTNFKNIFIPKEFIKAYVYKNAKILIDKGNKLVYLQYENETYRFCFENYTYVDYKRIIEQCKNDKYTKIKVNDFLEKSIALKDDGKDILIFKLDKTDSNNRKYLCLNNFFFVEDMKDIFYQDYNLPISFVDDEIQVIVMPIISDSDEEVEEIIKNNLEECTA